MILNCYSVKDKKAGEMQNIFIASNDEVAKRMFLSQLNQKDNIIAQYPEDFELFYILAFDNETGYVKDNKVKFLCNALIGDK